MAAWQSSTPSSKDRKYADAELFAAYLASDAGAHGCLADDWSTLACALPVFWLLPASPAAVCCRVCNDESPSLRLTWNALEDDCLGFVSVDTLEMCVEPQTQRVALLPGANKQRSWRKAAHKCGGKASSCCWPWPGL